MDYAEFFRGVTGRSPFIFQERLRTANARWLLLRAPTGLGKTDGLLISWLHRRVTETKRTARRLVWCLPGRALTEQVARVAEERVAKAGLEIRVCRLLGGSKDNDLALMPDEAAILVGTQDLLLSRALNRGYARNPFRWPIDFALLNNDCEWVLDEVQLLGEGLATSAQLAAFRERFGCFGPARTSWASATFDAAWLRTVDFAPLADSVRVIGVDEGDLQMDSVRRRVHAQKRVKRAPEECRMPKGLAQFAAEKHRAGTISLIICNTVGRAVEIRRELSKRVKADVQLLHSRFRAKDRKKRTEEALSTVAADGPGRMIVATQVIEAGIDLDASLLITDLAPWPSLVQRFGRVNRYGEREGCEIFWVDRPLTGKQQKLANAAELKTKEAESTYAPYGVDEVKRAAGILESLSSAAPADLPDVSGPPAWEHVLRKSDLLDLFDTSSDLGGNQLDISRFVRSGEDTNVYVAWRDWEGEKPPKEPQISDEELCPVPIGDAKGLKQEAWWWNALISEWQHPDSEPFPGMVLLLHSSEGHYTPDLGWSPESKERVEPIPGEAEPMEGLADERKSFASYRQLLEEHTEEVCQELERLLGALAGMGLDEHQAALRTAGRRHDWGKAHPVFQQTLHKTATEYDGTEILAKQKREDAARGHARRYLRHELASALAMLVEGEDDLAAFVAAAHHGRVRVVIRSVPEERQAGRDYIRGIAEGDRLPACSLGGGVMCAPAVLTRDVAQLGAGVNGESWTTRVLRLRDRLGPFRLAYLEMLLRAADERSSQMAAERLK